MVFVLFVVNLTFLLPLTRSAPDLGHAQELGLPAGEGVVHTVCYSCLVVGVAVFSSVVCSSMKQEAEP